MDATNKGQHMNKPILQPTRRQAAQGMVEFALVLPVLLMLTLGIMEVGRLLAFYTAAISASREGARAGSAAGHDEFKVFHYQNCNMIREQALRVGFFAGMSPSNITIHYDHGPAQEEQPFGSCPVNQLGPSDLELGDRIVVNSTAVWEPIVPLVPLQPVTLTSTSRRTILKDVGVEGPAPDDRLPKVSFHTWELEDCLEELSCTRYVYVLLNEPWHEPVYVNFATYGRAARGLDYTISPAAPMRVTIPVGSTEATIRIDVIDDALYEDPEQVIVVMGDVINGQPSTPNVASFFIIDNELPPVVYWYLEELTIDEGNFGTTAVALRARLNVISGKPATVSYQVLPSSTAAEGEDYQINSTNIIIPEGSIVSSITDEHIFIVGDYLYEDDETVVVELVDPVDATLHPEPDKLIHTLTIRNDDIPPEVFFIPDVQAGGEDVGHMTVEVWLSHTSGLNVPVSYSLGGTATPNADYTVDPASPVIVPAGQISTTLTLNIIDDGDFTEGDETIIVTITDVGEHALIGDPHVHIATITSDAVFPTVWFTPETQTVNEMVGRIYVRARLSAVFPQPVLVPYTLTGTALSGGDYLNLSPNPLEIPAGVLTYPIVIDIIDDTVYEPNETLIVTMGTPINAVKGSPNVHTVTIVDNEPIPQVFFTLGGQTVMEDVITTTVRVEMTSFVYQDVTVPFTIEPDSSAALGMDYTISPSPLIIPAGSIGADILVTVIDDDVLNEPNENVILKLGTPTNANLGQPDIHILEIIDNDACPSLMTLQLGGSKMGTYINHTSLGARDVTIDETAISWVSSPGQALKTIYYDNVKIFDKNANSSPTFIPSANLQWVPGASRLVPAGASMRLYEVQFGKDLAVGSYSLRLRFSNGCNIVLTRDR
jgi:hypothetical protein